MSTPHDIMVSYSWGQKPLVKEIVERLEREGYKVWRDESGIDDIITADIAKAIKEVKVVLICLSHSYQDSKSCKQEAHCINQYKKDIIPLMMEKYTLDGWVAILFSEHRYINMFDEDTFEEQFQDLLRILRKRFPNLVRNPATGAQANQIGPQSLTSNTGQYEGYNRPLQPQAPSQVQHQAHPQVPSSGSTFFHVAGNVTIVAGNIVGGVHYNSPSGDQTYGQQGAGSTVGGVHSKPAPSGDQTDEQQDTYDEHEASSSGQSSGGSRKRSSNTYGEHEASSSGQLSGESRKRSSSVQLVLGPKGKKPKKNDDNLDLVHDIKDIYYTLIPDYKVKDAAKCTKELSGFFNNMHAQLQSIYKGCIVFNLSYHDPDALMHLWKIHLSGELISDLAELLIPQEHRKKFLDEWMTYIDEDEYRAALSKLKQKVAEAGAGSTVGGVHSNPAPSGDQTDGQQGCRLSQKALLFVSKERYIMVSFKSEYRDNVRRIVHRLRNEGYAVWMDETDMENHMASDLANAIENAEVVLVCLSRNYKNSEYCRRESDNIAHFSKRFIVLMMERYRMDGWVANYYSEHLFTDFSNEEMFETKFQELLRRLQRDYPQLSRQVPNPTSSGSQATTSNPPPSNPGPPPSQPPTQPQVNPQFQPNASGINMIQSHVGGDFIAGNTFGGQTDAQGPGSTVSGAPSGDQTGGQQVAEAGAGSRPTVGGVHSNPTPSGDQTDGQQGCRLSQKALLFVSKEVGVNWKVLGIELGLEKNELDKIELDNRPINLAIIEMLVTWQRRRSRSENQLELMCSALKRYGNDSSADNLREKTRQNEF